MSHHDPTESTSPKQPPTTDSIPTDSIPSVLSVSHLLEAPEALEVVFQLSEYVGKQKGAAG